MQNNFFITSEFKHIITDVTDLWCDVVKFYTSFE